MFLLSRAEYFSVESFCVGNHSPVTDCSRLLIDYAGSVRLVEMTQVPEAFMDEFNQCMLDTTMCTCNMLI